MDVQNNLINNDALKLIKKLMDLRKNILDQTQDQDQKFDKDSSIQNLSLDNIRRARFALKKMNDAMKLDNIALYNQYLLMYLFALPRKFDSPVIVLKNDEMAERLVWEDAFTSAVESLIKEKLASSHNSMLSDPNQYKAESRWITKNNISIELCDTEQLNFIRNMMGTDSYKLINAWSVSCCKSNQKFAEFVASNNISSTSLLWHGSPTVNFISILENGLKISKANFGMFGKGLYFAPAFDKSRGYCSISGARWRGGSDSTAFLAICEVATGNPYYPQTNKGLQNATAPVRGFDSTWAKAGSSLLRDEVIVYNSSACRVKYIVETK